MLACAQTTDTHYVHRSGFDCTVTVPYMKYISTLQTKRIGRFLTTTVKEDLPYKLESAPPPITNSKLITALVKSKSLAHFFSRSPSRFLPSSSSILLVCFQLTASNSDKKYWKILFWNWIHLMLLVWNYCSVNQWCARSGFEPNRTVANRTGGSVCAIPEIFLTIQFGSGSRKFEFCNP